MADDADRFAVIRREAADDGVIVSKTPVAVQLVEPREQALHIIEGARTRRVPRDEHTLPRSEIRVELPPYLFGSTPQAVDRSLPFGRAREHAERLDLLEENAYRLFEFEEFRHSTLEP
jgi:hypothetical protein